MDLFEDDDDSDEEESKASSPSLKPQQSLMTTSSSLCEKSSEEVCSLAEYWSTEVMLPCADVGPVVVRRSEQGGRGVFAAEDLVAGRRILVEEALFGWGDDSEVPLEARGALAAQEQPHIRAILKKMHPMSLKDASPEAVETARRRYGPYLPKDDDDALRLALVAQFNGLDAGFFARICLFNHACGFAANCVRIDDFSGFDLELSDDAKKKRGTKKKASASVYATRFVKGGEELVFGYEQPPESARATRRRRLKGRYDFHCRCAACENDERENLRAPDLERELAWLEKNKQDSYDDAQGLQDRILTILGPQSPLALRSRRRVVNAALDQILRSQSQGRHSETTLQAFLDHASRLLTQQRQALGTDHLDVAATAASVADLIDASFTTSGSNKDHQIIRDDCRADANRILSLYSSSSPQAGVAASGGE